MRCGFGVQKAQIMMVLIRRLHDNVPVPFHLALSLLTFQREKEMPYSSYKFTTLNITRGVILDLVGYTEKVGGKLFYSSPCIILDVSYFLQKF